MNLIELLLIVGVLFVLCVFICMQFYVMKKQKKNRLLQDQQRSFDDEIQHQNELPSCDYCDGSGYGFDGGYCDECDLFHE